MYFTIIVTLLIIIIISILYLSRREFRRYENKLEELREAKKLSYASYSKYFEGVENERKNFYEIQLKTEKEKFNSEISAIRKNFEYDFLQWKQDYEKKIRIDAVARSQSSTVGKITEHLVPLIGEFPYNPRDVKWLGSPIDLLIFDGLDEGNLKQIIFLEIKTGKYAKLNGHERQLRDIIKSNQVKWEEIKLERNDK